MPTRQNAAVVACGANRPSTNQLQVPLNFPGGYLRIIRIVIPAGHAGLTGIALGYGGNPTIPFGNQQFYFGDDREIIIDYTDNVPGVNWSAFVFNTDDLNHSWEVDMDFDEIGASNATSSIVPVSPTDILAAGTAAMGAA
jgi:hypothetical protein